ncbi:MAG: hypothetical protein H8E25_05670 [Planctomycetes bacterium]|nr:hypothetical protein [Planctomycetota bacterium]
MLTTLLLSTMMMFAAQEPAEASSQSRFATASDLYDAAMSEYFAQLDAMYESGEFTELENPIEIFWDQFKTIAKDKTASSGERAQAQIWCVTHFGEKNWTHPDKVRPSPFISPAPKP